MNGRHPMRSTGEILRVRRYSKGQVAIAIHLVRKQQRTRSSKGIEIECIALNAQAGDTLRLVTAESPPLLPR
jgi:hypothetical protein